MPALSPDDIEELFSIRALLEPEVLKLSIPRLTEDDFSEAAAVLRKYVSELRRDDHVSSWGRLNWQFHSILYSRANQPRFMAIIRNVNNSGERYTRLQLYLTHGMKRANEEHHQILELCRQRDVGRACRLMRQHIRYAGESLRKLSSKNERHRKSIPARPMVQIPDLDHAFESSSAVGIDFGCHPSRPTSWKVLFPAAEMITVSW